MKRILSSILLTGLFFNSVIFGQNVDSQSSSESDITFSVNETDSKPSGWLHENDGKKHWFTAIGGMLFFNVGLAPEDENYNQFKICKAGENPNIVNIQVAPWADNNKGIYINFPSAEFTTISLPEGQYKVDGAGILLYLTAFTAKETEVTINYKGEDCIFTVYNDKGIATAIDNTVVSEKAIKMFENGQLIIIKNGVKYNALGSVIE